MKTLKLAKPQLDFFAAVLHRFGEVHAPVRKQNSVAFERLDRWSDAQLKYTRTLLPPKKYFLPPRETMFRFSPGGYTPQSEDLDKKIVLFGVHACDVRGLNILDEVFLNGPYPDPYYRARRANVAIIGIDCIPDKHCYCSAMHADYVEKGFDLFFYDIGDDYLVLVGTALGDDMVLATESLFTPVSRADVKEYKRRSQKMIRDTQQLDVEIRDLSEILEMEYDNDIWQELGKKCLACGSCTMVCPTCYCYDVADNIDLGCNAGGPCDSAPESSGPEAARPIQRAAVGSRCREWDSCQFAKHALVAGGENFRASQADRVKFRFYHKQRGFVAQFGHPSCVGCGRCSVVCPVGINDVDVINRLRGVEHVSC